MGAPPLDNCTAAAVFAKFTPLYLVEIGQFAFALMTIVMLVVHIFTITRQESTRRSSRLHQNLKVLYHVKFVNPCDYTIVTYKCLLISAPLYVCVIGFTCLHVAVFVERCLATFFLSEYARHGPVVGITLSAIMFLVAFVYDLYIYSGEHFTALKSHCMSTSENNSDKLLFLVHLLMLIDFVISVGDFALLGINKSQLNSKNVNYTLTKSYQVRENRLSIRLIFPLSVTHSVTFTLYLVLSTIIRRFFYPNYDPLLYATLVEAVHMMVCFYTFVSVSIFYYLRRRLELVRQPNRIEPKTESELHFKQISEQWQ
ncbi:serpentine type 7TM GPCR receptor class ab chemoreceptor domain-containing protein [Ditylenchus destructor]|nr:serpentine type 7TM GPCR receptor class ab chemoreceptor domain-containing protein [Ditylenchus destructor]